MGPVSPTGVARGHSLAWITTEIEVRCVCVCVWSGLEQGGSEWITTEIEVRIRESHGDDDFVSQTGVIRNISVHLACVFVSAC